MEPGNALERNRVVVITYWRMMDTEMNQKSWVLDRIITRRAEKLVALMFLRKAIRDKCAALI